MFVYTFENEIGNEIHIRRPEPNRFIAVQKKKWGFSYLYTPSLDSQVIYQQVLQRAKQLGYTLKSVQDTESGVFIEHGA